MLFDQKATETPSCLQDGCPHCALPQVDFGQSVLTPGFSQRLHQVLLLEPTLGYPCYGSRQSPDGAFPDSHPQPREIQK